MAKRARSFASRHRLLQLLLHGGLRMILETEPDLAVAGEATTGAEVVALSDGPSGPIAMRQPWPTSWALRGLGAGGRQRSEGSTAEPMAVHEFTRREKRAQGTQGQARRTQMHQRGASAARIGLCFVCGCSSPTRKDCDKLTAGNGRIAVPTSRDVVTSVMRARIIAR